MTVRFASVKRKRCAIDECRETASMGQVRPWASANVVDLTASTRLYSPARLFSGKDWRANY